jgi:hypothetical protein
MLDMGVCVKDVVGWGGREKSEKTHSAQHEAECSFYGASE